MQDKPKFIFNHGTGKFEGLTPEDDVKIEDLKKAKAAADINKFVKSTLPPDEPVDVNTINKELNKYRLPHDQLPTIEANKLNKKPRNFQSNKPKPRVSFDLANEGKNAYATSVVDYDKQPFVSGLNKLKRQPNKRRQFAMLYDAADYKEKAQMRKDYPDFNFKKDRHKSELREEAILKQKISPLPPNPYLDKKILELETRGPTKVEPDFDVEQEIKKKVAKKMAEDRANFVRSAGDKGLAELLLIKEGLF